MANILEDVQQYVVGKLSADWQLSGCCQFLAESIKDIDYEIKNALGRQGIVGVCMTPKATYAGKFEDLFLAWTLEELEIDIVENVTVNRGKKNGQWMTGQQIALRVFDVLCPLSGEFEGQFSPVSVEEGEDNGLVVNKCILKALVYGEHGDVPQPEKPITYQFVKLLDQPPPLSVQPHDGWMWSDDGQLFFYAGHEAHKLGDVTQSVMSAYVESQISSKADLSSVPTKTSDLSNDSGYLTAHQSLSDYYTKSETSSNVELDAEFRTKANLSAIPTKTSDLSNDSGFITSAQVPTPSYIEDANRNKIEADLNYTILTDQNWHLFYDNVEYVLSGTRINGHYRPSNPQEGDLGWTIGYTEGDGWAVVKDAYSNGTWRTVDLFVPMEQTEDATALDFGPGYAEWEEVFATGKLAKESDVPTKTSQLSNDSGFIEQNGMAVIHDLTCDQLVANQAYIAGYATESDLSSKADLSAVPTKTSDLSNDSGFITSADVPTKTSQLSNDSGFITSAAIEDKRDWNDISYPASIEGDDYKIASWTLVIDGQESLIDKTWTFDLFQKTSDVRAWYASGLSIQEAADVTTSDGHNFRLEMEIMRNDWVADDDVLVYGTFSLDSIVDGQTSIINLTWEYRVGGEKHNFTAPITVTMRNTSFALKDYVDSRLAALEARIAALEGN